MHSGCCSSCVSGVSYGGGYQARKQLLLANAQRTHSSYVAMARQRLGRNSTDVRHNAVATSTRAREHSRAHAKVAVTLGALLTGRASSAQPKVQRKPTAVPHPKASLNPTLSQVPKPSAGRQGRLQ